jgi:Domain of unknown function (DUF3859)
MRALVLLSLMATPAFAAGNVTGDPAVFSDIGAGIVCASGNRTRQPAPDTRAGFIELTEGPFSLGLATGRIPALPGLGFGVVASVAEAGGVEGVTVIVTHPPMGADRTMRETWADDYLPGDAVVNFFSFDLPEERVPGIWTIEAQKDGRMLYSARFEVVDPAAMPNFINPCEEPPPVS